MYTSLRLADRNHSVFWKSKVGSTPRRTPHTGTIVCSGKWQENDKMEEHRLTRKRVRQGVSEDQPGFYRLGNVINGRFYTGYVGRSDSCLQTRLGQHAQMGWFTHFVARPMDSVREAYRAECLFYHLQQEETLNKRHPCRPDETELQCPYCEFEERLTADKAENSQPQNKNVA